MTSGSFEQDSLKTEESDHKSQFDSKMNELKDEVNAIKTEMNDFKKEINGQLNDLKSQIEQLNDSLSSWKDSVTKESMNLKQRCSALEESQASNNDKISVLEAFKKRVDKVFRLIANTLSGITENNDHNKITDDQN